MSHEGVRQRLKKTPSRWQKKEWCGLTWRMMDLYPPNPMIPNVRWSVLTRHPPMAETRPACRDFRGLRIPAGGYPQPVLGLRALGRLARGGGHGAGTMQDFARRMRWLADEAYPEAEVVRVVLDNLRCTRLSRLRRPGGLRNGWSSTTPPSTHGGDRVQRPVPLLPEAAALRRGGPPAGSRCSGHRAQRRPGSTPGTHEPNFTAFTLPILRLTAY